ncbi:MAG: chemotaxis protein CheA, partial [Fibrobacterota bacterium]|nr:chemotaxis protein CheW [Chitinispirillaceae bacterium]
MQEKDMLGDLIQESKEHLQEIEPVLLELERQGNDLPTEMINQIFRAIHSIKGGFGFFGYKGVTTLSHSMEHLLSLIRDRKLAISNELVDALFKGIDKLKVLFDDFENSDTIPIENEIKALDPFMGESTELPQDRSSTIRIDTLSEIRIFHETIPEEQINDAIKNGKTIYRILLSSKNDLDNKSITISALFDIWERLGKIIDFAMDLDCIKGLQGSSDTDMHYSVIYATVLEPDLLLMGLNVTPSQVRIIDMDQLNSSSARTASSLPSTLSADTAQPMASASPQQIDTKQTDESLRVKVSVLNSLMNLAGELVLSRNQLIQQFNRKLTDAVDISRLVGDFSRTIEHSLKSIKDNVHRDPSILDHIIASEIDNLKNGYVKSLSFQLKELQGANATLQSIDSVTSQLQESIMQTRLQPVSVVFNKFPRVIRDLSRKLEKSIELHIVGQDVELDKSIVEMLSDPLNHLVRNSADHGIELPENRKKAGKDPVGSIYLSAIQEGGKVVVMIEDDGKGLDFEKIKNVAIEKRLITEQAALNMSTKEIQQLIMLPGFSTADSVSDVSGRGVGMDVVKSNVERLGGTIEIESEKDRGTKISLTLPLTLAIIPSLIIQSEKRIYAIPQVGVEELVRIRAFEVTKKIERIQGAEVMRLREKLLPLVRLSSLLNLVPTFVHPETSEIQPDKRTRLSDRRGTPGNETVDEEKSERRDGNDDRRANVANAVKIVVVKSGLNHFGLIVDSVFDNEEIVVKPLPEYFKTTQVYAGATILGDGKVAMILDPSGIALRANLRFSDLDKEQIREQEAHAKKKTEKTSEILLFDNGSTERFGMSLNSVARIEKVDTSEIELVGSKEFLKREGTSLPLVRIQDYLPVSSPQQSSTQFFIILPKNTEHKVGIVAHSVFDVVSTQLTLDTSNIKG